MTFPLQEPGEDIAEAIEQGWLPIREVARQTGVNAVTLRAWERRYGLIVPQRTPKGHRLFSAEHVQRIHTILTWLNRGVPVSQVKSLIDTAQATSEPPVENEWHNRRQHLVQAISELAERRVDDAFNQAMALYPPRTLCEQLLLPLLKGSNCAGKASSAPRWNGYFSIPGCAANSVRGCITTTANSTAPPAADQPFRPAAGAAPVAHRLARQQRRLPGGSFRLAIAGGRTGPGRRASATPCGTAVFEQGTPYLGAGQTVERLQLPKTDNRTNGMHPPGGAVRINRRDS